MNKEGANSRGGKRPGAGRKKADLHTRVICVRIPEIYAEKAKVIIERSINHLRPTSMEAKHNFSQEQQVGILNAVAEIINVHGSGMLFSRMFNDMYRDYMQAKIVDAKIAGSEQLVYDDERFTLSTYTDALGDMNEMFAQIDKAGR